MRTPTSALRTATLIAVLLLPLATAVSQTVAIEGGTIIPVSGEVIEGGTILIVDGKITAVGKEVELPFDATVIDATGKTLFPGMVLAHTNSGLDVTNENVAVAPFVDVYDSMDPSSLSFEEALRSGITTLNIHQGNNTVIGGMGRAVRPIGLMVEEMTIRAATGLKLSMSPKSGYDRMVQRAEMREAFRELQDYLDREGEKKYEEKLEEDEKKIAVMPDEARKLGRDMLSDDDLDDKHRNLYRLTKGRLDAIFYCGRAMDVSAAIDVAREQGFLERTSFLLGSETFKAVRTLKASGRPVILSSALTYTETDPLTGEETETFVPRVFAEAGVPFALQTSRGSSFGERFLPYQAARCVREGIDRQVALEAITLVPARIAGLADRVGSLEPGKDGNVLVLSGDPLDMSTMVEKVIINGREAWDITKDVHLKSLTEGRHRDMGDDDAKKGTGAEDTDAGEKEGGGEAKEGEAGSEAAAEKKDGAR